MSAFRQNGNEYGSVGLEEAAVLLSLDCMQPFVGPIGLQLDAESLKLAVREAIITNRRAFENGVTDPSFFTRLIQLIDARFGAVAKNEFLFWFTHVFTVNVHAHYGWRQWASAFLEFSGSTTRWAALMLPGRCSSELYQRFMTITYDVDIWALWSDVRRNALSDWDLEMYAIHGFDDESKDPFAWVVLTYEMFCFRRFWAEVRAALTDEELRHLWSTLRNDPTLPPKNYMRSLPDPLLLSDAGQ
jgi:hypothetical protein